MPSYVVTHPRTGQKLKLTGDAPPTEAELDSIFTKMSVKPSKAAPSEPSVPQWGMESPNLYGAYGAAKGVYSQAVRPSLETLGALGGALAGTPALGGALGYGIARKAGQIGEDWLVSLGEPMPQRTVQEETVQSAKDVAMAYAMGKGAEIAVKGLGAAENVLRGTVKNKIQELGKKFKIRTTLAEETGNPTVQQAEILMEKVPWIGLKKFRLGQHKEVQQAASRMFGKYVVDPSAESTAAMKEINDAYLTGLYEQVKTSGKALPAIQPGNVRATAVNLKNQYPSIFESIQDGHVKRILTDVVSDTKDKVIVSKILSMRGQPIKTSQPVLTDFNDLWMLRKGLGQEIRDARTDTARGVYDQLYKAVSEDMNLMFKGTPVGNQFKQANDAFIRYSVKFDAMRTAYDKAMGTTSASELFSPKKFSTELKKLANDPNYKKWARWSPMEIEEMSGLAHIMQVTKRAGQLAEFPPTGARLVPMLMGGGAVAGGSAILTGNPTGIAMVGGTVSLTAITRFLTTTAMGKRLCLAAARVPATSKGMQAVMNTALIGTRNYMKMVEGEQNREQAQPKPRATLVPNGRR